MFNRTAIPGQLDSWDLHPRRSRCRLLSIKKSGTCSPMILVTDEISTRRCASGLACSAMLSMNRRKKAASGLRSTAGCRSMCAHTLWREASAAASVVSSARGLEGTHGDAGLEGTVGGADDAIGRSGGRL